MYFSSLGLYYIFFLGKHLIFEFLGTWRLYHKTERRFVASKPLFSNTLCRILRFSSCRNITQFELSIAPCMGVLYFQLVIFSTQILVMLLNLSSSQAKNVTAQFNTALPAGVYTWLHQDTSFIQIWFVLMAMFVIRRDVLTFVSNGLAGDCTELDVHAQINSASVDLATF